MTAFGFALLAAVLLVVGALFSRRKPKLPPHVQVVEDLIWASADRKLRAIGEEAERAVRAATGPVLLVAHFPDVLRDLRQIADRHGAGELVRAVPRRDLSPEAARAAPLDESALMEMLVAERHPHPATDRRVMEFAAHLPCRVRITHHLSLEDPLFELFGAERIRNVMRSLGHEEAEVISHALVTRSVRRAQERVGREARGPGHEPAESAGEWLASNLPDRMVGGG